MAPFHGKSFSSKTALCNATTERGDGWAVLGVLPIAERRARQQNAAFHEKGKVFATKQINSLKIIFNFGQYEKINDHIDRSTGLLDDRIGGGAPRRGYRVDEIPNVQRADRTKFVSNPDGILTPQAVARIDSICYQLRHRNIAQVAVVAVDRIASDDMFDFGYKLFSSWGVGRKEGTTGWAYCLSRRGVRYGS